ncbi:MAG: cytochrome c3 family protein [Pirellulaceae bacterium]|nr:cytochrome c3 family protein [Pirellulaceae bacterium]
MQRLTAVLVAVVAVLIGVPLVAQDDLEDGNGCLQCHGNPDIWDGETAHLHVTLADLAQDVHWQKGIKCQDCHGGNADTFNLREAHAIEDGYRVIASPQDVAGFCGHCHSDAEYMRRFKADATADVVERFSASVHGQHLAQTGGEEAATCLSCHPAHQMRSAQDPLSQVHPRRMVETCGSCHTDQLLGLRKSVHHAAGQRNESGAGTPLDCSKCHGQDVHGMVPVKNAQSPVFLEHQVQVCGSCHERYLESYNASVHGEGLWNAGLAVTAVCSDCHNAHDIYYAADRRSSLHSANVGDTCGKCHALIQQRLEQSVHGRAAPSDRQSGETAGDEPRRPSCVDCHQGHDQPHPDSPEFRTMVPHRCGNCHVDYAVRYGMSLHGQLTRLGYEPAANCADCHGAHDIHPAGHEQSRLVSPQRIETCRQCHPYAVLNFAGFDPHADYRDRDRYPGLFHLYDWTETIIYVLVGLFLLHAFLWFLRSFVDALQHGRLRRVSASEPSVICYPAIHRVLYGLLLLAFMGLTVTGLPLKYSNQSWARQMADALGGFETTRIWHHTFAFLMLAVCTAHVVWVVRLLFSRRQQGIGWKSIAFGPDSPLPNSRDGWDMLKMLGWFVGMRRKPFFERWTYWEKFDYWGVALAMVLIGGSGLLLWFPNLFCVLLPGQALNVAHVLHSKTALMVAGCLFAMHFFNTHLRPEKFPLDLSVVTGLVSVEHLRRARPEYLERMRREGKLQEIETTAPSRRLLLLEALAGVLLVALGVGVFVWILWAYLGK